MKRALFRIIILPLIVVLTIIEWVLKLTMKVGNVAAGLFINVLLICMIISICNRHWDTFGLLALFMVVGLVLVYGYATVLYLIGEIKACISSAGK